MSRLGRAEKPRCPCMYRVAFAMYIEVFMSLERAQSPCSGILRHKVN